MSQSLPKMLKPPALPTGARIAIVSPASTPNEQRVHAGAARLKELGYDPVVFPATLVRGPLYYAGTIEQRLSDLHKAFADPAIDGIVCTRGGWGSAELLPLLDVALISANPKPFVGYSDHTSLHMWLARNCGLVTFYGPMVAADFARHDGVDLPSWNHALAGTSSWSVGAAEGLRILRPGAATGRIFGGCISIFTESLGTPYQLPPAQQNEHRLLFLEDIGTKPYQWDRMLLHLRYSGLLDNVGGIVFGDMRQCVTPEENNLLEDVIRHQLRDFQGPIAIGLRCGHVDGPNVTVPLGVHVELDLSNAADPQLRFIESTVSI